MKRLGLLLLGTLAAACSAAPNLLPLNDLSRPTDITFGCFGANPDPNDTTGSGALLVTGQPMQLCHPQDRYDPAPSSTLRTFAFMTESASGGLTVVDADHWKLVDLDGFTAGYGQAPLGQLPSQISASEDGCRLVTANRGSCDLSLVDPSVLVAPAFSSLQTNQAYTQPSPRTATMTIRPVKGDGTLLAAAPYEAVFLPQDTSSTLADPSMGVCNPDGANIAPVGWPAPAPGTVTPWYVMVTYPSCDLIAVVALPSGEIVSSAYVRRGTDAHGHATVNLMAAGPSPSCPVDCVGQSISAAATTTDAGSPDGAVLIPAPGDAASADGSVVTDGATGPLSDAGPPDAAAGIDAAAGTAGAGGDAGGAAGAAGGASGAGGAGGAGPQGGALPGIQYNDDWYVASTGPIGPSGIAIVPDGTRAYVSLANASYVLSVGLNLTPKGLTLPANPIHLHEGARGSSRVRLNIDPYRHATTPGPEGVFVGADPTSGSGDREYLYVLARDGTVRVISVFGQETECETNLDPLHLPAGVDASTACYPVDSDPNHLHRRPFSVGPGIHFPSLPVDIAAADVRAAPTADTSEQSVNGAHAWVITDSGIVYLVNLNPVLRYYNAVYATDKSHPINDQMQVFPSQPVQVQEPEPFVNTLRDRNQITYSLTLDPSSGPPRVDVLPPVSTTGPYLEPFWTRGGELNATATSNLYIQTGVFFPQRPDISIGADPIDRLAVTPQEWSVIWQGPLTGNRSTGVVLDTAYTKTHFPLNAGQRLDMDAMIRDTGTNYCASGVVKGDLLTLNGCTQNSQCGLGEVCLLDNTVSSTAAGLPVNGLCVDPNRADQQAGDCAAFLQTVRRYTIVDAYPNLAIIRPHLDELERPALNPCVPMEIARPSTDGGAPSITVTDAGSADGGVEIKDSCPDPNDPTTRTFKCQADPAANGDPSAPLRCLMKCDEKTPCRAGRVCIKWGSDTLPDLPTDCANGNCYCADAPPLTEPSKTSCFDQLTSYSVQVGNGFLVSGSQTGVTVTAKLMGGDQQCDPNTSPDPRFTFRIPMDAPLCTNPETAGVWNVDGRVSPDLITSDTTKTPDPKAQAELNAQNLAAIPLISTPAPADPCLYWGGPVAGDPSNSTSKQVDGGVPMPAPSPTSHLRALFRNSQISFVLANLDRAPSGQFVVTFDVHGGFNAQVVQDPPTVEVSMPARIVYGPVDALTQLTDFSMMPNLEQRYLFVVDQRRLGREQGGGPTRGQLLRIHPLGYSSTVGSVTGAQPLFQDYTASGGLFPIQ
jgi:hypothetical protein